jgi:hypothetical protein
MVGLITLDVKRAGEPCAGDPHARFDRAGTGNGLTATVVDPIDWTIFGVPSFAF